jgi:beta-lactam-binding protein with PASTA domain
VKRKPGRVIGQKPKPGTVLAAGAPVKLTVGRR